MKRNSFTNASEASALPTQICIVRRDSGSRLCCPLRFPGRAGVVPKCFPFAGRRARQSLRAIQFCGPTWLPVRKMCVGHDKKQFHQRFRRENTSEANLHGYKGFWLAPLLSPAPSWARWGRPGTLFISLAGASDNPFVPCSFAARRGDQSGKICVGHTQTHTEVRFGRRRVWRQSGAPDDNLI